MPDARHWITSTVGLVALVLFTVACGRGESSPVVQETATEAPETQTELVQGAYVHERAVVQPAVQWRSASVERTPMSLTAGDGSGLRLVAITGTVVIEDPLAFTELRLAFDNPEPRRREGRFELDLPDGAALSRLAMKIGQTWMEGEVLERSRGRVVFEDHIHTRPKVDPALLEKAAANRVSARVFPIEPMQRKEIIVSYSQPLGAGPYRLPLQGLPELDDLDLQVVVKTADAETRDRFPTASQRVVEVRERAFAPDKDLVVELEGRADASALRAGKLVAARIRPTARAGEDPIESLAILFDTSASSAVSFDAQVDRLGELLQSLGDTPVELLAFDQSVELVHEGAARDALGEPLAGLRERRAFGASDLEAAFENELVTGSHARRMLVWSDGVATAGETNSVALAELLAPRSLDRIDAYAPSTSADRGTLSSLTTAIGGGGIVTGPTEDGASLVEVLTRPAFEHVEVSVLGALWSSPSTLEGVQPGDDVVVYAAFEDEAPESVRVELSAAELGAHVVPTLDGAPPLLERSVALVRVGELQADLDRAANEGADEQAASLRKKLVEVAVAHRLLTPHTSLIVLESEADYRRYGIDRASLSDVLTAGPGGIDLLRRGSGPTGRPLPPVDSLFAMRGPASAGEAGGMGRRNAIPRMATEFDPDRAARDNGILGELQAEQGHFLASPYGAAFSVGNDEEDVWGGLTGTEVGEAYGVGGLGMVGTGRGGGGTGEGTIGLGNTGLIGKGGGGGTGMGYGGTPLSGRAGAGAPSGLITPSGTGNGYGRGSGAGFGGRGARVPRVRQGRATVSGALDKDIVRRIVRAHINEVRHCYNQALARDPDAGGRVVIDFVIGSAGKVQMSAVAESQLASLGSNCMAKAVKRWKFPKPSSGGTVAISYPFNLDPGSGRTTSRSTWRNPDRARTASRRPRRRRGDPVDGPRWVGSAHSGRFASLQRMVAEGNADRARSDAWDWATKEPDNSLALVALGEMLELEGRKSLAARVYGSIIDLHPHRADMRRSAAERLEALGDEGRDLAIDSYAKAVASRPDQLNGYRLLAWSLAKAERYEDALEVLGAARRQSVPAGRFRGVKTLMAEDQRLVAAAWLASHPDDREDVQRRLRASGLRPATSPSVRVVADWETDATDVDILVEPIGSGDGRRHADVRSGFGPEAWVSSHGKRPSALAARVRYFDRGAMGFAMGTVSTIWHDGQGNLKFQDRPFVLMDAQGSVELGRFEA